MKIQDLTPPVAIPEPAWKQQLVEFWQGADDHHKLDLEVTLKMGDAVGARQVIESWQQAVVERRKRQAAKRKKSPKKKPVRYAYSSYWYPGTAYAGQDQPAGAEGGGESIHESAEQQKNIINRFANSCAELLKLTDSPQIVLHNNTKWSEQNGTFGRYTAEPINTIELATSGRHIIDILRTLAHEMTHAHQNETTGLPDNAGETGSPFEDQANAMAGRIMRHWAAQEPEMFRGVNLEESSGYIPTTKQKNDPRFKTALTVDVHPGQTGREANKMGLQTDAQGKPALLIKSLKNALREFKETGQLVNEQDFLGEIRMTPSSLRAEAAKTGALAGMEFEMIVPDIEAEIEPEYEPDWDQDERARSFDDIRAFFHDGDYNGRRAVDDLIEELDAEYEEWVQEQTAETWNSEGTDYVRDFIVNNDLFDRDGALDTARDEIIDANPDLPQESEEFTQLLTARLDEMEREFAEAEFEGQGSIYQAALDKFTDEQRDEYDERSWLDETYSTMQDIQRNFDIQWPHWYVNDSQGGGADINQIADEFSTYMKKPVTASSSYHGARREPGKYVVEPDGSLEGDNPGDAGLEFVSPPMPIDEMIADLNRVKAWADKIGAYTNDSTGLHINISVPNYSIDKLDYVKLALLMGDERVLNEFGRMGNAYTKSATSKIRDILKKKPDLAPQVLDQMRGHMKDIATKAIHSGITDKYTSINTKTGYIEFRSPGGDWLDTNFSLIESTLMRFTVAMSAAINPEAYRQEYLKKLYKLLESSQDKGGVDVLQLFANYSAGDLDKAALIRQVRAKQLERDVARGKAPAGQQYWWNVQWDANRRIEVVASNKNVARQVAAEEWDVPVEQLAVAKVTMLRPYEPPQPRSAADNQGNWGIWITNSDRFAREPNTPVADNILRRFPSQAAAMAFLERSREENPRMRTDIEVREIPAPVPQQIYMINNGSYNTASIRASSTQDAVSQFSDRIRNEPNASNYSLISNDNQVVARGGSQQYEIFNQTTGQSLERFTASSPQDAAEFLNSYRSQGPHRLTPDEAARTFDARQISAATAPVPGSTLDLQRQRADAYQSVPIPGVTDVELDIPLAQRSAGATAPRTLTTPGQGQQRFTGEWKIVDANDRELHRFGGVGNVQADANRIAMDWLRQNPGRMQAGVTVVPVMEP